METFAGCGAPRFNCGHPDRAAAHRVVYRFHVMRPCAGHLNVETTGKPSAGDRKTRLVAETAESAEVGPRPYEHSGQMITTTANQRLCGVHRSALLRGRCLLENHLASSVTRMRLSNELSVFKCLKSIGMRDSRLHPVGYWRRPQRRFSQSPRRPAHRPKRPVNELTGAHRQHHTCCRDRATLPIPNLSCGEGSVRLKVEDS